MRKFHTKPYQLKYSQNFLRGPVAASLVVQMQLQANDTVVEIGPGTGQLTRELLQRGVKVLAIEADPNLSRSLITKFGRDPNFTCFHTDFLTWELPSDDYIVVGNIPFAITALIMRKLILHPNPPRQSYIIMQREVAERFVGQNSESLSSLLLKVRFAAQVITQVPRTDFVPQPRVDAVLLRMQKLGHPILSSSEISGYVTFITKMFADFQPDLDHALRQYLPKDKVRRLLWQLRIDHKTRRSAVTFSQWLAIWRQLQNRVPTK